MAGERPFGPGAALSRMDASAWSNSSIVNGTSKEESVFVTRSGSQSGIRQPESRHEMRRKCCSRADGLMGTAGMPPLMSLITLHACDGSRAALRDSCQDLVKNSDPMKIITISFTNANAESAMEVVARTSVYENFNDTM